MKPGVLTNHVMSADEYGADIAGGKLYAYTWPGGLLFLRERESYHMLSYYVTDISIHPDCDLPLDTFAEIAYKPSGTENTLRAVKFWEQAGLSAVFERVRLTRLAKTSEISNISLNDDRNGGMYTHSPPLTAKQQDIDAISKLLYKSFDHRTGHIPDYQELADSIKDGQIICIQDSRGEICGLLRWIPRVASVEIRQLAIHEDMRGKGLAHRLLAAFVGIMDGKKITVWARDGYAPALKSYVSAGFAVDGWRSTVLIKS